MALTAGIVGLPNVGKSTLFNAITKSEVEAANYPFATIEPNVGVVEVPDPRLDVLTSMVGPEKKVPTHFEFTDIAGIVEGASEGEGLGNQFLANIREVDSICHVVRCFEDENITHVAGRVDPAGDIDVINTELALADLDSAEKQYDRIKKKARTKDPEAVEQAAVLEKILPVLEEGRPVRTIDFSKEEREVVKNFFFLTAKPVLYVANIAEDDVVGPEENPHVQTVQQIAEEEGTEVITVSARIEEEIAGLDEEDQEMFLEDLGLEEPGLNVLIRAAYSMLGLGTFFTVGEKECRAWTFKKGMTAPQAAGVIHSDFERGFIRAETVSYEDYVEAGGIQGAREAGKYRSEGKDYIVKDGDIMLFRFNV